MTSKLLRRRVKNAWLLDLHRWLGGLALIFTGVHILAIMSDTYVHFGVASVLVPLASHWHPVAIAWGVASLYLLAAVELTSLARRHLSYRLWRQVHFLSFPLFVFSTIHGLTAGTDSARPMAIIAAALGAMAVAVLTTLRVKDRLEGSSSTRAVRSAARPAVGSDRPGAPASVSASASAASTG
jgi:DMSO/TMAO reductase YedYZ heme-binding membrane subunit